MPETPHNAFGGLAVRIDPWQPEFGPEFAALDDAAPSGAHDTADIEIERPAVSWSPIPPGAGTPRQRDVWFIDGVRRLEVRVTARSAAGYCFGAFGAYGVGAVSLSSGPARFERFAVGRLFALASAEQPCAELRIAPGLTYLPLCASGPEPDAPLRAIHGAMRQAEEALAREAASSEDRLVVVDGPLTFEEPARSAAVGYIKRVVQAYLGPAQLALLARLEPGQRTPLFALRGSQRFSRISWFLRLSEKRKGDSDFSGIVRLEVAEKAGVAGAQRLADACGAMLPDLKGRRALDRRAPQNLLPIAALEGFLRRRLGDERIARRRIESFVANQAE